MPIHLLGSERVQYLLELGKEKKPKKQMNFPSQGPYLKKKKKNWGRSGRKGGELEVSAFGSIWLQTWKQGLYHWDNFEVRAYHPSPRALNHITES